MFQSLCVCTVGEQPHVKTLNPHDFWMHLLVCLDESLHPYCLSCHTLSLLPGFLINNICTFSPCPPMESGLQRRCQETELPLEVPAGELSQLQVHVLQPSVSQAEAQELKQVRPLCMYLYICVCVYISRDFCTLSPSFPNHSSP